MLCEQWCEFALGCEFAFLISVAESLLFSHVLLLQGATLLVTLRYRLVVCLSVSGRTPLTPPLPGNMISGQLRQF